MVKTLTSQGAMVQEVRLVSDGDGVLKAVKVHVRVKYNNEALNEVFNLYPDLTATQKTNLQGILDKVALKVSSTYGA